MTLKYGINFYGLLFMNNMLGYIFMYYYILTNMFFYVSSNSHQQKFENNEFHSYFLFITIISAKPQKNNRKPQLFDVLLAIQLIYRAFDVLLIYGSNVKRNLKELLQWLIK